MGTDASHLARTPRATKAQHPSVVAPPPEEPAPLKLRTPPRRDLDVFTDMGIGRTWARPGDVVPINVTLYALADATRVEAAFVATSGVTLDGPLVVRVGDLAEGDLAWVLANATLVDPAARPTVTVAVTGATATHPFVRTDAIRFTAATPSHVEKVLSPAVQEALGFPTIDRTLAASTPTTTSTPSSDRTEPIMLVKGYAPTGNGGDVTTEWWDVVAALQRYGWPTDPSLFIRWGLYECDGNNAWMLDDYPAQPTRHEGDIPLGQTAAENHAGGACAPDRLHTQETALEHLAYHWAWGVHEFTQHGGCVKALGYSMGGLIIRWALYRVDQGLPGYPPKATFCVEDVTTMGTPHGGTAAGTTLGCKTVERTQQCEEQAPDSAFLATLAASAPHPQGGGGTDWTLMGSDADDVAPFESATGGSMVPGHVVRFFEVEHSSSQPLCSPCDEWMGGPNAYGDSVNAHVNWLDREGTGVEEGTFNGPWVGRWVDRTLAYDVWACGVVPGDWPLAPWVRTAGETYHVDPSPNDCYYSLAVDAGTTRLVVDVEGGADDRDLAVKKGQTLVCGRASANPDETCVIKQPASGEWDVHVIDLLSSFDAFRIQARTYQENDCGLGFDAGDAHATANGRPLPIASCMADFPPGSHDQQDWYAVSLSEGQTLDVALTPNPFVDVDLCAYPPSSAATPTACSRNATGQAEALRVVATEAGLWRLAAYAVTGEGDYTLDATRNEFPAVAIAAPSAGARVLGTVLIQGGASDADGTVTRVEVKIGLGPWQPAVGTTAWEYAWDTTTHPAGDVELRARAFDGISYSPEAVRIVHVIDRSIGTPTDCAATTMGKHAIDVQCPAEPEATSVKTTRFHSGGALHGGTVEAGQRYRVTSGWTTGGSGTWWLTEMAGPAICALRLVDLRLTTERAGADCRLVSATVGNPGTWTIEWTAPLSEGVRAYCCGVAGEWQSPASWSPAVPSDFHSNLACGTDTCGVIQHARGAAGATGYSVWVATAPGPGGNPMNGTSYAYAGHMDAPRGSGLASLLLEGLDADTTYHFRAVATNASTGEGPVGPDFNATTRPATADDFPYVVVATPADGATVVNLVRISGTATDDASPVQAVEVAIDAGPWQAARGTDAWSFTWNTTTVPNGSHVIRVRASDGGQWSVPRVIDVVVANPAPLGDACSAAPTGKRTLDVVCQADPTHVSVATARFHSGGALYGGTVEAGQRYRVTSGWTTGGSGTWWLTEMAGPAICALRLVDLQLTTERAGADCRLLHSEPGNPGTWTIEWTAPLSEGVRAYCCGVAGEWQSPASWSPAVPSDFHSNLGCGTDTCGVIQTGGGVYGSTGYSVWLAEAPGTAGAPMNSTAYAYVGHVDALPGSGLVRLTLGDLQPGGTYWLRSAGTDADGERPASPEFGASTFPPEPPGPPVAEATNVSETHVRLAWTPSGPAATSYRVTRTSVGLAPVTVTVTETTWDDHGIEHGRHYNYTVVGVNGDGEGEASAPVGGAGGVANLRSRIVFRGIAIEWDAHRVPGLTGYDVLRDGVLVRENQAETSYQSGSAVGVTNTYTVRWRAGAVVGPGVSITVTG